MKERCLQVEPIFSVKDAPICAGCGKAPRRDTDGLADGRCQYARETTHKGTFRQGSGYPEISLSFMSKRSPCRYQGYLPSCLIDRTDSRLMLRCSIGGVVGAREHVHAKSCRHNRSPPASAFGHYDTRYLVPTRTVAGVRYEPWRVEGVVLPSSEATDPRARRRVARVHAKRCGIRLRVRLERSGSTARFRGAVSRTASNEQC